MEGEEEEKPEQEDEYAPEQLDSVIKAPSAIPVSKGASAQPVSIPSLPIKSLSISPEVKSNVVLRTSVAGSSISEKALSGGSSKASKKFSTNAIDESEEVAEVKPKAQAGGGKSTLGIPASISGLGSFPMGLFNKRSPFTHNPPQPEERRPRIECPRTPREYIINLREDLADFQESHGLPRTRDYSFVSLGLALAQETVRAVYSVFLMFAELFPILAIVSLILRFALDKLIEILETPEPITKIKKTVIFCMEMIVIVIPLYILIGTIVLPLVSLIFSIFKRLLRFKGGRKKSQAKPKPKPKPKPKLEICSFF